ncbi:intracellular septation protein A, partial [Novosphingobium hassiacum]|nr:intracellular septation protein A [Novosphingobium hassiacum]
MMRVGLFKPVHVKTLAALEQRMLLTSRRLIQRKLLDAVMGRRIKSSQIGWLSLRMMVLKRGPSDRP